MELQVGLGDEALEVDVASDISQDEARRRLGRLYLTTLTILLGELERLRDDPALASRAEGLEQEPRTGLRWEERVLLHLAVVPPAPRLPAGYRPSELGRLLMVLGLFPHIGRDDPTGRAASLRKHFLPLRRTMPQGMSFQERFRNGIGSRRPMSQAGGACPFPGRCIPRAPIGRACASNAPKHGKRSGGKALADGL